MMTVQPTSLEAVGLTAPPSHTATAAPPLRIAVASSGLGYVRRGIETWAEDLALALRRAGQDVTLFQAGPTDDGGAQEQHGWRESLGTAGRLDPALLRRVEKLRSRGGWRYGFGSPYQAEQTLFALRLWARVRSRFDVLNVQDPWLALILDRLHRAGLSRPRVILGHGTEESPHELRKFSHLQHLAPCYLGDWERHRPARQAVFAVPNFVDTDRFAPGDRAAARAAWGLPQDRTVVLCVAAIKKGHKRVDYLLREFAAFAAGAGRGAPHRPLLVVAGAREGETDEVIALGESLLGEDVRFLQGVDRGRMPDLFRAADLFAIASLHEMMPIAVLEALASGLPVACNDTPTLRWMAGPAGCPTDLSAEGAMAAQFARLLGPDHAALSRAARAHAVETFSEGAVLRQYLDMYAAVTGRPCPSPAAEGAAR